MSKRVLVAGGTGFIGQHLCTTLRNRGYEVCVLTRHPGHRADGVREAYWDGKSVGPWAELVDGAFGVVNLAGRSVNTRHTPEHKREIMDSRVNSTHALAKAMGKAVRKPAAWVQASTLAIYGEAGDRICNETTPVVQDFTAEVTRAWEEALFTARVSEVRRAALRIGFVLGRNGGALGTLARLTRWFLGGSAGSGRQFISWIHIDDMAEMFVWALERADIQGPLNACAPGPVTNAEFMRALRRVLHRPWSPPAPAWAVRLGARLIGTEPDLILSGRRCVPQRFEEAGYRFKFPVLEPALRDLLL